ncbi:MAG TPA: glycosyltransferase [Polyangia bacterium]|nr:glycosyltransferase [Polyangia bacterium]
MKPTVSVILNSYNQGQYLEQAIESVLAQTCGDFELILTDNGSTDDSPALARKYAQHEKVRLNLQPENRSISTRFNEAIKLANGEYISFLYSDDYYLPTKLERQLAAFATLPDDYAVVYGPNEGFNVLTGKRWQHPCISASGYILPYFLRNHTEGFIGMNPPLTKKRYLERYPFFDDLFAEGEAVYIRIAMTGKFHYLAEPLTVMREHESNISKAIRRNHENFMQVVNRLERHPDFPRALVGDLRHFRARIRRDAAWQAVRMGAVADLPWARQCFERAVGDQVTQALHPRTVIGWTMTLLPPTVRAQLNRLGFALRQQHGNAIYREDYR